MQAHYAALGTAFAAMEESERRSQIREASSLPQRDGRMIQSPRAGEREAKRRGPGPSPVYHLPVIEESLCSDAAISTASNSPSF